MRLSVRPFSQLSVTMIMPAMQKPEPARIKVQPIGSTHMMCARAVIDMNEAKVAKLRMWPTRATILGASNAPDSKPT